MNRKLKEQVVSELNGKFQKAKCAILTDYCGMNVEEMNKLRSELRSESVEYRVVKNTIVKLAARATELELLDAYFSGPTGIAMSYQDPLPPARALVKFMKDYPKIEIKAGVLDGKLLSVDDIELLARTPSREVLLAQALSVLISSQTSLVGVLNGVILKFMHVLEAVKEKKSG